jgi:ribosomal-protein-alanine N-acetyltransferase
VKQTKPQIEVRFESLTLDDLDAVMRIERLAYAYPWSRAVFEDTVVAGYQAQRLLAGTTLLGYFVAMKGVEEVHLLNITVAPAHQYRGWAKVMLEALSLWARGQAAKTLWLEVRVSNTRALRIYKAQGFVQVGRRAKYYQSGHGQREDAIVMSLTL